MTSPFRFRPQTRLPGSRAWDKAILHVGLQTLAVAALTLGAVALVKLPSKSTEADATAKQLIGLATRSATIIPALAALDRTAKPVVAPEAAPLPEVVVSGVDPLPPLARADFGPIENTPAEPNPEIETSPLVIALPFVLEPAIAPQPTMVVTSALVRPTSEAVVEPVVWPEPATTLPSEELPISVSRQRPRIAAIAKPVRVRKSDNDDRSVKAPVKKREAEDKSKRFVAQPEEKPVREHHAFAARAVDHEQRLDQRANYRRWSEPAYIGYRGGCRGTRWIGRTLIFGAC